MKMKKQHVKSALLESKALGKLMGGAKVWLKMENEQVTGSFKDRGMLNLVHWLKHSQGMDKIVSSSGGNAGLAATYASNLCGMKAQVIVPETTKPMMVEKLKQLGADVQVVGKNWNEADAKARQLCEQDSKTGYVPPFDHPKLWEGHASMVNEIVEQKGDGKAPDLIVASCGGGGLVAGVLHGLKLEGGEWEAKSKVIIAETEGAASMNAAIQEKTPIQIDAIKSVATSLGALKVSQDALDFVLNHSAGCEPVVVSDKMAIEGCRLLANEHRVLVEPACGTAIAAARSYMETNKDSLASNEMEIVIIVCGGSAVNLPTLNDFVQRFDLGK